MIIDNQPWQTYLTVDPHFDQDAFTRAYYDAHRYAQGPVVTFTEIEKLYRSITGRSLFTVVHTLHSPNETFAGAKHV